MQKVDVLIGVVGLVAIVVTGLGIALYDSGATEYFVEEGTASFAGVSGESVDSAGIAALFDTPNNTIGASFDVTINAGGQSAGGAVTVTLVLKGPDGSETTLTDSFDYGAGSGTFTIANEAAWGMAPGDFTGDDSDVEANTLVWSEATTIEVFVDGPCGGPLPIPVCLDTYTADISGAAEVYTIRAGTPDVETA